MKKNIVKGGIRKKIPNYKFQISNFKQYQMTKIQMTKTGKPKM